MVTFGSVGLSADPTVRAPLSLDAKLALLRRRRRRVLAKRLLAAMGPLVGMSLLLLAAFGGMASLR